MMKKYTVKVKVVFEGEVYVTAKTRKLAADLVKKNFSGIIRYYEHNNCDNIKDWKGSSHSDEVLMVGNPTLYVK